MILDKPVTTLPGVGEKLAAILAKCQIHSVSDLLFHLPYRYQDRTRITPICDLRDHDYAVIEGTVIESQVTNGAKKQLLVTIADKSELIQIRYFHFYPKLKASLAVGKSIRAFGEVRLRGNMPMMAHPELQCISDKFIEPINETLTPIYSSTKGLSQQKLRKLTELALALLNRESADFELLPPSLLSKLNYPSLVNSLEFLHHPPPDAPVPLILDNQHPCQLRLAFEELLSHRLSFLELRQKLKQKKSFALTKKAKLKKALLDHLPFKPTNAQARVVEEIEKDLQLTSPMYRLVQGDVGSGKTLVAALASLFVIENQKQVALMAPTELLAEQHLANFQKWFDLLGLKLVLLLGKQTKKERKLALSQLLSGEAQMAIGTHALFQDDVAFHSLGLVIIDEQHRFGVKQRLKLQEKGQLEDHWPHQLIMTATPIPRTLAMTQYASLDMSVIDELPPGRTPIQTVVLDNVKRPQVIERLRHAFHDKKQAYWVCTLIEESETLQCQTAEETQALLLEELAPYKVGLVHGRMKGKEKTAMMQAFLHHELDLLVATTVIEVGVDVPNASLMIIENAERLGLSQLHQLRGRVGRGSEKSHCVLLYQSPLSQVAKKRLKIMRETNDGFVIANEDFKLRGSGEIIGTKQSGSVPMRIAELHNHQTVLNKVNDASDYLHQHHAELIQPLIKRWLGDKQKYSES